MFAGINGAGKSTLYTTGIQRYPTISQSIRVNADEIARDKNWDWHDGVTAIKSMRIEIKRIRECINSCKSFNMETTLSGHSKTYLNILNDAKSKGFSTHLFYVGLKSPELAIERVKNRVEKGGHDIPEEIIIKRYPQSLQNLSKLVNMFDTVDLFDNSEKYVSVLSRNNKKITFINDEVAEWATEAIKISKQKYK
ncbi:atpase [Lactobacillus hamsteri DSM 5661 = JCM 6256]|uniref:UDP-N-acetylglucosamine kinase n=2 Tax=Lactobacillus hamsteri TaxID=96565 RepID=A0A0R1YED9_9LACO|nr:atpase [Lactobacillus hamsteri DSM 5661 = JCM 6256]